MRSAGEGSPFPRRQRKAFSRKISLTGASPHQQQEQAAAHGLPRAGQDVETGLTQAFLQAFLIEAQPAVAVAAAHGLVVMLEEIGHEQVPRP